jgi:hypothetical protein
LLSKLPARARRTSLVAELLAFWALLSAQNTMTLLADIENLPVTTGRTVL